jgi:hypothetical protein
MQTLLRLPVLLVMLALLSPRPGTAQELNCSVTVDFSQVAGAEFTFLEDLRGQVTEYLNERRWTEDRFEEHERIDCSVQITIEDAPTVNSFRARMVVASRRPIYGTVQNSTVLQLVDNDWQFVYNRGTPLIHDPERYDPLTSILDFYAFIVLGFDYDTFSELGGAPHFERARRLADRAQAQGAPGWAAVGSDRGRSQLISQLLDPRMRALRQAQYLYHFEGLDQFVLDTDAARGVVLELLDRFEEILEENPRNYLFDIFFTAKNQELTAIFEGSSVSGVAYSKLVGLDPSRMSEYNKLLE